MSQDKQNEKTMTSVIEDALSSLEDVLSAERLRKQVNKLNNAPDWDVNRRVFEFTRRVEREWKKKMNKQAGEDVYFKEVL